MYNVLFHVILFTYLLASLLFWLSMGLRQRWLFHLAHVLLGGGFGLQTLILGYNLYIRTFPLWGEVATSLGLLPGLSLRYISRQYGATVSKRWGPLLCRSLSSPPRLPVYR